MDSTLSVSPAASARADAAAAPRRWPLLPSDLRGLARLGFDATAGIVDLVEAMHHTIASRAGIAGPAPAGRTRGVTGGVYRTVRGSTRLVGSGVDAVLGALVRGVSLADLVPAGGSAPAREQWVAVVNGLWGDHLAASGNPLAIAPALRTRGRALDLARPLAPQVEAAGPGLLVQVHGLCMNDLQWSRNGHDHGLLLQREQGWTPLHFHYNSGRHVSENGRDLARLLEQAVAAWPLPLREIAIVGHSMGGLVARSACHAAAQEQRAWPALLRRIVFLGTPHHGAPLERGGRVVDLLFGISPYAAPFGRIGRARSAGITDLRYGNLQDADWQGRDRHDQSRDDRRPTPLPPGVAAFAVAATTGDSAHRASRARDALIGDGLVPVASALGEHADSALALHLPPTHRLVVTRANHWDLLDRAEVAAQLLRWMR